jgi:hypothetical protein
VIIAKHTEHPPNQAANFLLWTKPENISEIKTLMTGMRKQILFILFCTVLSVTANSQNPWELGAEYMRSIGKGFSGNIAGPRYETFRNKNSFSIGLTYHFSSKGSYSSSKGFGMYAGYRYSLSNNANAKGNGFVGLRALFSFENFEGKTNLNSLMCTPVAEAGYQFLFLKNKTLFTTPSVGYGYSIKITKENNSMDEDIGGRIIPAIAAGYRF